MRVDKIINEVKQKFYYDDGGHDIVTYQFVKTTCDHCDCSTKREGVALFKVIDGDIKTEFHILKSDLKKLLGI